jgi:hypothetical protein
MDRVAVGLVVIVAIKQNTPNAVLETERVLVDVNWDGMEQLAHKK